MINIKMRCNNVQYFQKKNTEQVEALVNKEAISKNRSEKDNEKWANRKGELGEYKINIQLDQFPKNYKHISDLMIKNTYSSTGYSQIDHLMLTPYGIFVIETKNYQGTIYGGKSEKRG